MVEEGQLGRDGGLTKVKHELDNLHDGDVLLPPDTDTARGLEVVPVHDDMDHEVQRDRDPGDGGVTDQLGVAEQRRRSVVVGVEECERLLLEEEEAGINQLKVFGQVVQLCNLSVYSFQNCPLEATYVV